MSSFWERKTFCLITGGSRGLGEGLANVFASKFARGSVLVLVARNENGLKSIKSKINSSRPDLKVFIWLADLCKIDGTFFKEKFETLFKNDNINVTDFSQCLLVHNAGFAGNLKLKLLEQNDKKHLDDFWTLNLTSTLLINSVFFSIFSSAATSHRYIVQITSLLAIKPYKSWGPYCAAKAARDMLFSVVAQEEPKIRILSYAPGPLQTDMFRQAIDELADEEVLTIFKESSKSLLTCEQSSQKLAMLLHNDLYKSGSHLDYFDIDDSGNITNGNV